VQGTAVHALLRNGTTLYVAGNYQYVGAKRQRGLVGLDTRTGRVIWDAQIDRNVYALKLAGELLYAGGEFGSAGQSNRQNIAAIRLDTARATAWNPQADRGVFAMEVEGNVVYVGGQFTTAGTKPRNRLAGLDATTGVATPWNPNPNGLVRALAVSGNSVYVAGDFTAIGGQNRRAFAAVNTANGAAQALDLDIRPTTAAAGQVLTIHIDGDNMYLGGSLTNALGEAHCMFIGRDLGSGEVLPTPKATHFNGAANADFGVLAFAVADGRVFVGGDFYSMGGVPRQNAAALSLATGAPTSWAPEVAGPVFALAAGDDQIYLGGTFTNVNGEAAKALALVDATGGGNVPGWSFSPVKQSGEVGVTSLALAGNRLYVGGSFTGVADLTRRMVAAVESQSGAPIAGFDAKLTGGSSGVSCLLLARQNLYVAGDFTGVGGHGIARLAAVSASDGDVVNWVPAPNQEVRTIAATGDTLYVGGRFTQLGGVALRNFGAFSLPDHSLQPIDAALSTTSQGVNAMAATPQTLYVSGDFDAIGGEFRQNLACLASFNASAYEWDPALDERASAIAVTEDVVVLAGNFRFIGQSGDARIAAFLNVFPRGAGIFQLITTPDGTLKLQCNTGDRTDCILQAASDIAHPAWTTIATNELAGFNWTTELRVDQAKRYFRAVAR
jgi:outer membrane protein assembly factor BamB